MAEEVNEKSVRPDTASYLEHGAFPSNLSRPDVILKFLTELKKILPADEIHVIDPYALDAGGGDAATYARDVVALLKPALQVARHVVFIYGKPGEEVREFIMQDIALVNPKVEVEFRRGNKMHARYLVANRSRALRMEFSFNRIGKYFGTISLVEGDEDLAGIVDELERLHPTPR